ADHYGRAYIPHSDRLESLVLLGHPTPPYAASKIHKTPASPYPCCRHFAKRAVPELTSSGINSYRPTSAPLAYYLSSMNPNPYYSPVASIHLNWAIYQTLILACALQTSYGCL